MKVKTIDQTMQEYLANDEILGGALVVRKDDKVMYENTWGYADFEKTQKTDKDSIYRMCSMTKPIIAVGIMMLAERGKLSIEDPVKKFIPGFADAKVLNRETFFKTLNASESELQQIMESIQNNELELEELERDITISDLLSHSSGLGQGPFGELQRSMLTKKGGTLKEWTDNVTSMILDFQPGKGTGYSPLTGFDILGRVIEVITGESLEDFCQKEIFDPLEMKNTGYRITGEKRKQLVTLCTRENDRLVKVTDDEGLWDIEARPGYVSGSAGLFSTVTDYESFVSMLCNFGEFNGKRILKKESVEKLYKIIPKVEGDGIPGMEWGLGVIVRTDPKVCGEYITKDTYGWSGSYGTHFLVSPEDNLECVFVTNRVDLNGAFSYISKKIEELVFNIFVKQEKIEEA